MTKQKNAKNEIKWLPATEQDVFDTQTKSFFNSPKINLLLQFNPKHKKYENWKTTIEAHPKLKKLKVATQRDFELIPNEYDEKQYEAKKQKLYNDKFPTLSNHWLLSKRIDLKLKKLPKATRICNECGQLVKWSDRHTFCDDFRTNWNIADYQSRRIYEEKIDVLLVGDPMESLIVRGRRRVELLNSGDQFVSLFLSVHRVMACWILNKYYAKVDKGKAFGKASKPPIPLHVLANCIRTQKIKIQNLMDCDIDNHDAAEVVTGLFYIPKSDNSNRRRFVAYFRREYEEINCESDKVFVQRICNYF